MTNNDLYIVHIEMPDDAWKTSRILDDDSNPDLYDVIVYLSRHVNEYEAKELSGFGILRADDDRMCALIQGTTLEQFRDGIDEYNEVLASAVEKAKAAREAAEAEDARLKALAAEINAELMEKHRAQVARELSTGRRSQRQASE